MTKDEDRNYTIGCIGLVALIYGLFWLISDPNAGAGERDSYAACVKSREARFDRRNPDATMSDDDIADLVLACSHVAKVQNSN